MQGRGFIHARHKPGNNPVVCQLHCLPVVALLSAVSVVEPVYLLRDIVETDAQVVHTTCPLDARQDTFTAKDIMFFENFWRRFL